MNDISNSLVEKIRKLLALSTSDNRHESELAMTRAKELCVKHDIDLASVAAFAPKESDEPILKSEHVAMGKRLPIAEKYVVHIIQGFFNTKVIYHGNRYWGRSVVFIGKKKDIEISTYVYNYLNTTFLRLWRQYYNDNEKDIRLEERGSFFYGLRSGLESKLSQSQKAAEQSNFEQIRAEKGQETAQQVINQYALMVTTNKERLESKLKEFYPKLGKVQRSYSGVQSRNAFIDGVAQGKNINLNRAISSNSVVQLA